MAGKLIFIPFAFDSAKKTGNNIKNSKAAYDIYCKNFCVALVSMKKENPDCDVALVTNTSVPGVYEEILTKNNIKIFIEQFESFTFPDDFPWSLAFYKLCALNAMVKDYDYDFYCYLDADTVANRSLDGVWKEAEHNKLLYDINHGFNVENYRKFIQCAADFYGEEKVITQYGGEFFTANRENATKYVAVLLEVYRELRERNFAFRQGDEFIVALAANRLKDSIRNAGAYIYRYWTGYPFRLVSTCYEYNPVSVLHMPDEKKDGIIKIFDCYVAKGKYPSREKIYKLCHLRNPKLKNVIRIFLARLLK